MGYRYPAGGSGDATIVETVQLMEAISLNDWLFLNNQNPRIPAVRAKEASITNSALKTVIRFKRQFFLGLDDYHLGRRRRRKQSPSSPVESVQAKSARHCNPLPNECDVPLVEDNGNGAPVNWTLDSSQSADQHNIPNICPSPSRPPSSAPTKLGQSTLLNLTEPPPAKPRSVIAFDVVRAAFTKRIRLEDFLTECKCADFSFAAMDRSPVARMMEGTDYVIGIMAYEQSRESKVSPITC
ncbi:unnamed protein product [Dibothriocephalus latus]|uniref:Uncharacterized protein n=1 Tax=Dibothriocephalus latus TaxID=60516 RepID=A0A3P7NPM4_DIBLA|nr:unnamed protein product [Dibothriocephalus latus]